jgi:hypothetical protein
MVTPYELSILCRDSTGIEISSDDIDVDDSCVQCLNIQDMVETCLEKDNTWW